MTFCTPKKLKSPQVLRFVGHVCLHSPLTVSLGEALEEEGAEYMRSFPISVTQHIQEEIPRINHILLILITNFLFACKKFSQRLKEPLHHNSVTANRCKNNTIVFVKISRCDRMFLRLILK